MKPRVKPRLSKLGGRWYCVGGYVTGYGLTAAEAFQAWDRYEESFESQRDCERFMSRKDIGARYSPSQSWTLQ